MGTSLVFASTSTWPNTTPWVWSNTLNRCRCAAASPTGAPLPESYRSYLAAQDGARLEDDNQVAKLIFGVGDVPDIASTWEILETCHGRVPAWLLPVADDEHGNLFAVSLREKDRGPVWFWGHEEEASQGEPPAEDNLEYKAAESEFLLVGRWRRDAKPPHLIAGDPLPMRLPRSDGKGGAR